MARMQGIVKWFNSSKGYGFICPLQGGDDVFAHFSVIEMEGYKCLRAGQLVDYSAFAGPKGMQAEHIQPKAPLTEEALAEPV